MVFQISLYVSLGIFGVGLIYKISTWFRYSFGIENNEIRKSGRFFAAVKGIISTLLSRKIITLFIVFLLDVLLQRRIFRESRLRWINHMCIFGGFVLLLFMHALEKVITASLFPDYASTLNPFLFLRNFFGLMVIVGLALSVYRRHFLKISRLMTNRMDHYLIIILSFVMISGFLLEATKIVSHDSYRKMVEDYADSDDPETLKALESFWVENYGVVSPDVKGPFDEDTLELGKELHETSCLGCHSRPQWAFLSYGASKMITPVAGASDKFNIPIFLWYLHFLACFAGLAYLPFSRMFHVFASPLSLLLNAVMDPMKSHPANIMTRQMIELDACTHCGTCSVACTVGISFEEIPNINILPSEKLVSVKKYVANRPLTNEDIRHLQEGLYLCVNCYRCTLVCPVGINLQDLWFKVREAILQRGYPEFLVLTLFSFYRGLKSGDMEQGPYQKPLVKTREAIARLYSAFGERGATINLNQKDKTFTKSLTGSLQGNTFSYCYTCTTCTSACPVVRAYDNPPQELGLVPHQIIHAAIVGLPDMAFRSKMLWNCLGCYQCQEACPQGVRVTDVFYELKNMAISSRNGRP